MNDLQQQANEFELKMQVLMAASTPRLIAELTTILEAKRTIVYSANAVVSHGRTGIILNTGYCRDKSYEEILVMPNVTVTERKISSSITYRRGYVSGSVDYTADLPQGIIELLRSTGNIKTTVSTYTTVSCTV